MVDSDGIAHADIAEGFDGGHEVACLARADVFDLDGLGCVLAQLCDVERAPQAHHADLVADLEAPVEDSAVDDDAAVIVVDGVEDQGAGLGGLGRPRRGEALADRVEQFGDALACFSGAEDAVLGLEAQHLLDFHGDLIRACAGQVDLVENRDDLEILLDGEVRVDDGLGLHALGGIDDEQRAFTGLERPADLVAEVHVPGRVDEVEHVLLAVVHMHDSDSGSLDRDATLALEIHRVEELRLGLAIADSLGGLKEAVGQRGLAVVDVGDDGEVSDVQR